MKKIARNLLVILLGMTSIVSVAYANTILFDYRNGLYENVSQSNQISANTDPVVLYQRGLSYAYGYGVARNLEKGLELITSSATKGYLPAQLLLAKYYLLNKEKRSPEKALTWFIKATDHNDLSAQMYVAAAYLFGYGVPQNEDKARKYYIAAAQNGSPIAQFTLAEHFLSNKNQTNRMLGILWLKRASKQGYKKADELLATLDNSSKVNLAYSTLTEKQKQNNSENKKSTVESSVPTTPKIASTPKEKAIAWLIGEGVATTEFAYYDLPGVFTQWDSKLALQKNAQNQSPKMIFVKPADFFANKFQIIDPKSIKISEIINVIGKSMYDDKKLNLSYPIYPVKSLANNPERLDKINTLANFGDAKAMFILGQHYQNGLGVEKNSEKAFQLYLQAAQLGYLKAEYIVALMYLKGDGVAKSYDAAFQWLEKSAYQGNRYSQYTLGLIYEYGIVDTATQQKITMDKIRAASMYSLAASNELIAAKLNLADLLLSGAVTTQKTIAEIRAHNDEIIDLYESAVKKNSMRDRLPLAYYYVDSADKEKQKWAFQVAKEEAEKGNKYADFLLALLYDRGVGVEQDQKKAVKLFQKSVAATNPIAEFVLGSYYFSGDVVKKNQEKAMQFLQNSATTQLPFALYNLAVIMYNDNPNSDFIPLLKNAVQQNYMNAKLLLADYYFLQQPDSESVTTAAKIYSELAELGYQQAQLKLGYLYDEGISYKQNFEQAASWYKKSAEQGNQYAQFLLANMYQVGKLGEPDFLKAKYWYYKSAEQKNFPAIVAMGYIFETMSVDYKSAMQWYQFAAKSKDPIALYNLALMYDYGKGVKVDYKQAYDLYSEAEASGYVPAQYNLANLYLQGAGVSKDFNVASSMFQKAASQDNAYAQYQLALMYENGLGVEKDPSKAYDYYKKAADKGIDLAQVALKRLDDKKTTEAVKAEADVEKHQD